MASTDSFFAFRTPYYVWMFSHIPHACRHFSSCDNIAFVATL
jgi:hypothetical protein